MPLGRLAFIPETPIRGAHALFFVTDVIRSPSGRLPRLLTFMGCVACTRPLVSGKAVNPGVQFGDSTAVPAAT